MKKRILTLSLILMTSAGAFACEVSRALQETHFSIDPSSNLVKLESKINNAQLQVGRCDPDEKFILINSNTIYFQDDTSRAESVSGKLLQTQSNCTIQSEIPFQKLDDSLLVKTVTDRHQFLKQCVQVNITDLSNRKIQMHPSSKCQVKVLVTNGSSVQTDGMECIVAVSPTSQISIQETINPDCLNSSFLNQNQIPAGDYESVLKIWPVELDQTALRVQQPIGLRYVRHTILPEKGFMPRTIKDTPNDTPFVSALSTNVSPGSINIRSMGKDRVQFQPTFLVENISKEFCRNGTCVRPSAFVAPIAGQMKLTKIDGKTLRQIEVGRWMHAIKVPANWSGMAEFHPENNLSGLSQGALQADLKLIPGDTYTLSADFFEPRTLIDESLSTDDYLMTNSFDLAEGNPESLPTLPKAGQLGQLKKLQSLPTISLGTRGIIELSDQANMKKNWTHHYDRICNSQNLNCQSLTTQRQAFSSIKMTFKIGENKEIIPVSVEKKSPVFENYQKIVQDFPKKVCN